MRVCPHVLCPRHHATWLGAALLTLAVLTHVCHAQGISIQPTTLTLSGPEGGRHVLVLHQDAKGRLGAPAEATVTSSNPWIAEVDARGWLKPVADGEVTLTAKLGDHEATATVKVVGMTQPQPWSFRNHVEPVLAKLSCNSGACHGALAGKGGFRLSLRGYDPDSDHFTITRQARGRRVELSDPGRSLVLAKPTGAIPHKGGVRFDVDSLEYRVLSEWIAHGAPGPREDDPRLQKLEVLPANSMLAKGQHQQVLVQAHYSDGRVEDVTRWAKFASADETVAQVDQQGKVQIVGNGVGAITAWYSSQIAIARVTSPYGKPLEATAFGDQPPRNFIDQQVNAKLAELGLPPSPLCNDAEFIRRAYIDTLGVLPTAEETQAFLAQTEPSLAKRDQLIDRLLARPEFVDYWTYRWSDLLLINGTRLRPVGVKSFYQWIRGHVEANTPWDRFVRELITAQGRTDINGATNFYALHQDPESITENVSQAFLGLSIGCAKCHNHPLEKWTNNQYYAMANMFARVRGKGWGGDSRSGDGIRTVYVESKGDLIQPLTGKPQPPSPLDGNALEFEAPVDRRVALSEWLTSPDNPYFARSIANRVWANFFGVGLVESVDDMRDSNPASNEELLSAAASHVVESGFDLKSLMREILRSNAYQRSSMPLAGNREEHRFYSRYYPRRLMAEVLLDAISQVTDAPSVFDEIAFPGADRNKTDFYPKGTRAVQLYDSAVASYFLKTFGRNTREITCECERSDEASMVQVLHLSNGDTLNEKLAAKEGRVQRLFDANADGAAILNELFHAALSRSPTDEETRELVKLYEASDDRRAALEDLFWSVMTSREFLFNH
ncbi:MAG: DUF1553 domain-containing protein [Planctomycetales bacterium]|nr:DUF1553 domain-containing protein [Planctomycetales bacterium]